LSIKSPYLSKVDEKFWLLNTDITSLFRPHSPTLAQRSYVYKPNNKIKGNRPVGIGYEVSTIGLSCRQGRYGTSEPAWNPPLSMQLVPYEMNKNSFTASQVNNLLNNTDLPIGKSLTVNALDSNYSSPEYIEPTYSQSNLINVIRLPSNRNVWKQLSNQQVKERREENEDNRGANNVYGEKYKLNQVENWKTKSDEQIDFGIKLNNGKTCIVEVDIWEDMMIRSKRGHNMKDKPFRLVRIRLLNAQTMKPLYKKIMWLGVWGERRKELTGEEIYWSYRNRYDIEHFFRFGKQRLLLDKFQTPEKGHIQNWLEVVNLSYWLLFVGKAESKHKCRKWQQYDKNLNTRVVFDLNVTPSQVQLQMSTIILSFDKSPYLPKLQIKGKGRQLGQVLTKREHHPVLKKKKKRKKQKKK